MYMNMYMAGLRDIPWPSEALDNMDKGSPCPEDDDFFYARPDAAKTEEAINKFLSGLESQEQAGFNRLHSLLSSLPVPVTTNGSKKSHTEALDRGFLPKMDEEQQKRFTPSELLLYRLAVEYR
jgi:hypothetical protein